MAFDLLNNPTDLGIIEAARRGIFLRQLLRELADVTPTRVEALLHAFSADGDPPEEPWAEPFRARSENCRRPPGPVRNLGAKCE